jgi:predicted SnoaL-like aldol condensation-catalyzing enzyme
MNRVILLLTAFFLFFYSCFLYAKNSQEAVTEKKMAIDFLNTAVNEKDFAKASAYLSPYYKQHNPDAIKNAGGLKDFIVFLKKNYPKAHTEIKQIYRDCDSDTVILLVHSIREPGTEGRIIVNIFKFVRGKINERWEVAQDINKS